MPQFFLGEIRMFPYGTVPNGWLPCDGQLLLIHQNSSLFGLIGTAYGGDGDTTFALPRLKGGFVAGSGGAYYMGGYGGEATHTLTIAETPAHTHDVFASGETDVKKLVNSPELAYPAVPGPNVYAMAPNTTLGPGSTMTGGAPHDNMPPYVAVSFCIAMEGVFPDHG